MAIRGNASLLLKPTALAVGKNSLLRLGVQRRTTLLLALLAIQTALPS